MLEALEGLTGEAVKSIGAGASELMLHFPNTAKKVPQNRPGYPNWAGKCIQLQYPLIPEFGPSALAHLSEHPVPGAARQFGEIRHFCIPYGIPGSIEPWFWCYVFLTLRITLLFSKSQRTSFDK